ncbi:HAD-IA family hydrolase [Gammaproteobacteria bacterium]|nr:HAD-IA family hydrolase [Gammaproteobacteria bacterium]
MQENHKTKLVLFDLDGTLVDTSPDFILSLNNVLVRNNRKPIKESLIRKHVSDGSAKLTEIGFNLPRNHFLFDGYRQELLDEYKNNLTTSSKIFDGIKELLDFLKSNEISFGIVTNKPLEYARPVIENFIELDNCKVLVCPDHVNNIKPDPEGILQACSKLSIDPSKTIYIGDHPKDLEAGISAGTKTIGCRYGYSLADCKFFDGADLVDSAQEIISLI